MKLGRIILFLSYFACVIFAFICWTVPFGYINSLGEYVYTAANYNEQINRFVSSRYNANTKQVELWWMGAVKLGAVDAVVDKYVWLGGETLGFEYISDGVLVIAKSSVGVDNIEAGDVIKSVDGKAITSIHSLAEEINSTKDGEIMLKVRRDGNELTTKVKPKYDMYSQNYKLGVWAKDSMNGLGTLTYITQDGNFGALGHPIVEPNTNVVMEVLDGGVYPCVIFGVEKASRGYAGELKGTFTRGQSVGKIAKNCEYGVFGKIDSALLKGKTMIKVGGKMTIHPGKATILSSIDGKNVKEYEIEIIKTNYQSAKTPKNFVFRVIDKELISKTGGIVQGMSGSPIVQDGLLVGAVTHVFVNDATKGFGTYIDNMLNE